jgi:DNA-binding IclR family transcriptional regulator
MIDAGLARQDPVKRHYYLGPSIFSLALNSTNSHQHLIMIAQEYLKQLQILTQETVALHALVGIDQICLDEHIPPEPMIKFTIGKGEMSSAIYGASGKVLLSMLSNADLNQIKEKLSRPEKRKFPSSFQKAFGLIDTIRKQGFAESSSEVKSGASALSVPIKNYFCPLALSVMGPENRIIEKRKLIIERLKKTARLIEDRLSLQG